MATREQQTAAVVKKGPCQCAEFGCNGALPSTSINVTGAKGGNVALASLLAALVSFGLITDSTTA